MNNQTIKSVCEVFNLLKSTSGRKDKIKILTDNKGSIMEFLLDTAFNPMLTYGVIKFNDKKVRREKSPTLNELVTLRQTLVTREVTGHAAIELLEKTLCCEDGLIRKWLSKIFQKNAIIGISAKTINLVYKELIPEFEVGLCTSHDVREKVLPKGTWLIEPKLDGLRCLSFINYKGEVTFLSRNGKELYNLGRIKEQIESLKLKDVVLDGELKDADWNESMSITKSSKTDKDNSKLIFHVFDRLKMVSWDNQVSSDLLMRKQNLENDIIEDKDNLKKVKYEFIYSWEEGKEAYDNLLKEGYEGAVLKKVGSNYPFGRGNNWLKWKPEETYDIRITGVEEGKGRNEGRLGQFICDLNGVQVQCGGGFSDQQREHYWENRKEMIGVIIEVKCQEKTKDGSLRFPVFVKERGDKDE